MSKKDILPGGLGDKKSVSDFRPTEISKGKKVEKEHTKDPRLAAEIAKDHLTEDPRYYSKLRRFELSLKKAATDYADLVDSRHDAEVDRQHDYEYSNLAQRNLDTDARGQYLGKSSRKFKKKPEDVMPDSNDGGESMGDSATDMTENATGVEPTTY